MDNLRGLLIQYELDQDEIVNAAHACGTSHQQWQKFISQYISPEQADEFKNKLQKMNIFYALQEKKINPVTDCFHNISTKNINIQNIYSAEIEEYKWGDKLMNQIQQKVKNSLKSSLLTAKNMNEFLQLQIKIIFDILSRRYDLKQYFDEIKLINKAQGKQIALFNLINGLTFRDFVIILVKYCKQERIIGSLMNTQGIPVPVLVSTQSQVFIPAELSMDIFSFQTYSLILNVGTPGARKCGKSIFISKIMSIKESYCEDCNFMNSINLTSKINFNEEGKVMLCDFNGQISMKMNERVKQYLQNLSNYAQLLIIHLKYQELVKNKVLETDQFRRICEKVSKIIIFVRDTEGLSKHNLNQAQNKIPEYLKDKAMLRCLQNFQKKKISTEHKQQLTEICSRNFNVFKQKRFSYISISEPSQQMLLQKLTEKVSNIIRQQLYSKDYKKKKIIPLTQNIEQLSEVEIKIKNEDKDQIKVAEYINQKQDLIARQQKTELSKFVQIIIGMFQQNKISVQIFQQQLSVWKNIKQQPLRKRYLQLSDAISDKKKEKTENEQKMLKQQMAQNLQKRNQFQISVDKIISQLIQLNLRKSNWVYSKFIKEYYENQIVNLYPINIVDGNTLKFGNQTLKNFFHEISYRYANKKIYTISIIGAQSSAKSTLLNYLFRCRFQTSAGRCTKGVYMNICQIDDIVIIVLDTEGLLSVSARDKAFDHQIATFVLKISNLVIINNKGELTANLSQMLEVCLYVLQCLHKGQDKSQFSPKKILFSIRDQTKPKGDIQQEMLSNIKNTLQKMKTTSNLDYTSFITIQANDILSFPNAFTEEAGLITKVGTMSLCDKSFGNCILGMRRRMIKCLKQANSPPANSLYAFYLQAQSVWYTIQNCGKQILNYKTIAEIRARTSIQELYVSKQQEYTSDLMSVYEQFLQKLKSTKDISTFNSSEPQLEDIKARKVKQIIQDFYKSCKVTLSIQNDQWIKAFDRHIEALCRRFANDYKDKFHRLRRDAELNKDELAFEDNIKNQFKHYISLDTQKSNKQEESIIINFNKFIDDIVQAKKKELFKLDKPKLNLELKNIFNCFFQLNTGQLKLNCIEDCIFLYDCYKKNPDSNQYISKQRKFKVGYVNDKQQQAITTIFKKKVKICKQKLSQVFKINQINQIMKIQKNSKQFLNIIEATAQQCKTELTQFCRQWPSTQLLLQGPKFTQMLLGYLFEHIKNLAEQLKINQNKRLMLGYQRISQKYKSELQQMIKLGKDINQIMNVCLENYTKELEQIAAKECKEIVQNQLYEISKKFTPEAIFKKATQRSFQNSMGLDKKKHYIQCYKMVKNINGYIFQILCQQEKISKRSHFIENSIESTCKNIKKRSNAHLKEFVKYKNANNTQEIVKLLQQMKMLGFSTKIKDIDQISLSSTLEQFSQRLNKSSNSIQAKIFEYLRKRQNSIRDQIENFINNELRIKIIGCQACCPICNMKCMSQMGHPGTHKVSKGCHVMGAYGGCSYSKTKKAYTDVCMTKQLMARVWGSGGGKEYNSCKELIDANYPQWSGQFSCSVYQMQNNATVVKYKKIWANIEAVIIKYKYTSMLPSDDQTVRNQAQNVLTDNDMQQYIQYPLSTNKLQLKNY